MNADPDAYSHSFRKRMRILFSPLRLTLFAVAIIVWVGANVLYINNGGGPEWLGLASVIPLWACVFWELATDTKMRRFEREGRDRGAESHPSRLRAHSPRVSSQPDQSGRSTMQNRLPSGSSMIT